MIWGLQSPSSSATGAKDRSAICQSAGEMRRMPARCAGGLPARNGRAGDLRDCLARWETAYACSGSRAEDFARFFGNSSGRDRAALIRSMLTDQGGLEERLGGEIRHAYCAKHMADFLAGTSADTCE